MNILFFPTCSCVCSYVALMPWVRNCSVSGGCLFCVTTGGLSQKPGQVCDGGVKWGICPTTGWRTRSLRKGAGHLSADAIFYLAVVCHCCLYFHCFSLTNGGKACSHCRKGCCFPWLQGVGRHHHQLLINIGVCMCMFIAFPDDVAVVTGCLTPVCEAFMLVSTDYSRWQHWEGSINAVDWRAGILGPLDVFGHQCNL